MFSVKNKARHFVFGFLLAIGLQIFSLFRKYPENPKCGKLVEPFGRLSVLINCDSAVFMKDADNPARLLDGTSDYQDRPAHAFLISIILKLYRFLNLPDKEFNVTGLSGSQYSYSAISYILFVGFNLFVLTLAIYLVTSMFNKIPFTQISESKNLTLVTFLAVGIFSANELTKTFFWTPHSQMFNLLLPAAACYLISTVKSFNMKSFLLANLSILVTLFFYPAFAILMVILLFAPVLNYIKRACISGVFILPYLLYPFVLNLFGGEYRNTAILKFRQFVWVLDAVKDGNLLQNIIQNGKAFLLTFPIIPSVIIAILFLVLGLINKKMSLEYLKQSILSPVTLFIATYLTYLYFMGFYSRRLTLGFVLFLELLLIVHFVRKLPLKFERFIPWIVVITGILILTSWLFTSGPLV
jgi:hypothetical protein